MKDPPKGNTVSSPVWIDSEHLHLFVDSKYGQSAIFIQNLLCVRVAVVIKKKC